MWKRHTFFWGKCKIPFSGNDGTVVWTFWAKNVLFFICFLFYFLVIIFYLTRKFIFLKNTALAT